MLNTLTQYWYLPVIAACALFALWIALGKPGAAPDDDELASARTELESALLLGEPDRLSQLERSCGVEPRGGQRALAERYELQDVALQPMPWFGPRRSVGTARITLRDTPQPCAFKASFSYRWLATGEVKTTVHGAHVSTHGVTGTRAEISELRLEKL